LTSAVVDASIAPAWCFPDESSDYTENVLIALGGKTILVPAIWSLEVANAVARQRRKRLRAPATFPGRLKELQGVMRLRARRASQTQPGGGTHGCGIDSLKSKALYPALHRG
jgi:predicted nucleic acid-binding protein